MADQVLYIGVWAYGKMQESFKLSQFLLHQFGSPGVHLFFCEVFLAPEVGLNTTEIL